MKTPLTPVVMLWCAIIVAFGCFVYAVLMQREAMVHRAAVHSLQGQMTVMEEALENMRAERDQGPTVPDVEEFEAAGDAPPVAPVTNAGQRVHQAPPQPPEGAERRTVDPAHLPPDEPAAYAHMRRQVRVESALDREFDRLERRQEASTDEVELGYIRRLKALLLQVDELYQRLDEAETAEERATVQGEMRGLMGDVIRLSQTDRNHRMAEYARSLGVRETDEIVRFLEEVEGIFRETDTDWFRLFQPGR